MRKNTNSVRCSPRWLWPPVAASPRSHHGARHRAGTSRFRADGHRAATGRGTEPAGSAAPAGEAVEFETGLEFNSVLLPKFTGIAVFDQANEGAQEAAAELGATPAEFLGPTADNSVAGQIEIMTNAATQGRRCRHDLEQRR